MVTGIATAMRTRFRWYVSRARWEQGFGHRRIPGVDNTGITLPVTKHNYVVTRAEDVAPVLRDGVPCCGSGRPGPDWSTSRRMRSRQRGVRFCGGGASESWHPPDAQHGEQSIAEAAELILMPSAP